MASRRRASQRVAADSGARTAYVGGMEADHLTRLLALRLTKIAPDGFRAVAIGTMLHYACRFGAGATGI
jgi:hypothetical protein